MALNRLEIRRAFERRFTAERMASDYVRIYRSLARLRSDADVPRPLPKAGGALQAVA
jgi:hypothetical protein